MSSLQDKLFVLGREMLCQRRIEAIMRERFMVVGESSSFHNLTPCVSRLAKCSHGSQTSSSAALAVFLMPLNGLHVRLWLF